MFAGVGCLESHFSSVLLSQWEIDQLDIRLVKNLYIDNIIISIIIGIQGPRLKFLPRASEISGPALDAGAHHHELEITPEVRHPPVFFLDGDGPRKCSSSLMHRSINKCFTYMKRIGLGSPNISLKRNFRALSNALWHLILKICS
jgi:hypothetical protein